MLYSPLWDLVHISETKHLYILNLDAVSFHFFYTVWNYLYTHQSQWRFLTVLYKNDVEYVGIGQTLAFNA